jgi:glycosyltransferase involved in cell wall biosynthesis
MEESREEMSNLSKYLSKIPIPRNYVCYRTTQNIKIDGDLKKNVWPLLRKQLKDVELHIWGAYCGPKVLQLHQPKEGFYVCGRADTLGQVFSSAKILIAPLRFGAGVKGKLIDAMYYGVPSVTTSIGAESMCSSASDWGGAIEDSIEGLIKATVKLYSKEENWKYEC